SDGDRFRPRAIAKRSSIWIVDYAKEINAGLIVMATDGRDGFLDALRGSHSERVLRRAHCPLLIIPVGSRLDR
ncbi:MAG: universal stress protein, partial [Pirellula sp.]